MVIGIDATRANRPHKSGIEWYAYHLIKNLSKIDPKNQYILYCDSPLRDSLNNLLDESSAEKNKTEKIRFDKKGFQIIKSEFNNFKGKILKWKYKYFWTQIRLSSEMIFNSPDVLFVPSHTLPIIHPRKSIITIHDVGFLRNENLYSKDNIGPINKSGKKMVNGLVKIITKGKYRANTVDYLKWSTMYAIKNAYKILTVSQFSKMELEKFYSPRNGLIKVIHNGYDNSLYKKITNKEEINKVLNKYGINGPYLFYLGRIERKKNIINLVEAFGILKERNKNVAHKLVLAGDASFGYDEVNYMIREYNIDSEVILTGWIEENDLPYLFNGATAFIFPSNYEGFGIPLLQAMACETPIGASVATSIPEVVDDAALLFNPSNANSIAISMELLIFDEKLRNRLIARGKERIKMFNWDITARQTLKELES